jgi:hypothetical protein
MQSFSLNPKSIPVAGSLSTGRFISLDDLTREQLMGIIVQQSRINSDLLDILQLDNVNLDRLSSALKQFKKENLLPSEGDFFANLPQVKK